MVLGLGSRSKKDRASAITQLVELDLHLHEVKPWIGLAKPSKTPLLVALRWSRGERLIGSSRNLNPTPASGSEAGKIVLGESLCISVAPNRDVLKRAKKSYPDLDHPLVFSLVDMNDPKGKPLAQTSLDLSSLASITGSKLVAVPFPVSKKVAKGAISYLHLTAEIHQDDKTSSHAASAAASASLGNSARTSDASSMPPLDDDTQQMLVAALMSDDENDCNRKEEEIDSFTDDDDDNDEKKANKEIHTPKVTQDLNPSPANMVSRQPQFTAKNAIANPARLPSSNTNQRAVTSLVPQAAERQPEGVEERVSRQAVASPRASPVKAAVASLQPSPAKAAVASPQASPIKAAAIAAAAAYTKKHSFLPRHTNSYMDDSDDSLSDLDGAGNDEFSSRFSKIEPSPRLLPKGSQTIAANSQQSSSFSVRGTGTIISVSVDKSTQKTTQERVEKVADINASGKGSMSVDGQSKLVSTSSLMSTTHAKDVGEGRIGAVETASSNFKDSRSESATFLRTEAGGSQKIFNNENGSSQRVERSQANLPVDSEREAVVRHQAKISTEQKAKVAVKSPLREKGPQKITISKSPDSMKGRPNQSPVQDSRTSKSPMQEAKAKSFKSPDLENEKGNKKVNDENRQKISPTEVKGANVQSRIQQLEAEVENLKGELRDVAAVEAALYSTTSEHGSSSMKLHAPARRLARVYLYACKHWSQERRASCARNTMSGLILIAKACGNDVPRLTFWWSNTTVLREIVSTALNVLPASPKVGSLAHPSPRYEERNFRSSPNAKKVSQKHQAASLTDDFENWREPSAFTYALERLESWIYTKVVESIWWQVLTPQMQQPINQASSDYDDNDLDMRLDHRKHEKKMVTPEVEDARQGNVSVEIWKKAFLDAYERLCPVRSLGVECGCLPMLNKLVLEACVLRLDVAMFNAILRDDEVPTDPVSDPISDVRVLPIPNSSLSFGLGAQLKNTVATLSSFISNLTSKDSDYNMSDGKSDDEEKNLITFPFLKAMGGLLMLPKDMLIDKSLRKEVCPTLQLSFIGKILSKFQPDEFSPEPVTPELLDAINAEVAEGSQMQDDMEDSVRALRMAFSPAVVYNPPQSSMVRLWIGDAVGSTNKRLARSNSSVLRKGHTSDDEIDELEAPISWLMENTMGSTVYNRGGNIRRGATNSPRDPGGNRRFMLLREVWSNS